MTKCRRGAIAFGLLAATRTFAAAGDDAAGVDAFNRAVVEATKAMDNAAVLALWEENGVSVLPNAPPLVGKPAIGESLERIALELPCTKMNLFTLDCTTVALEGDFASERCVEHRIIGFPDGKPPLESRSHVLYVLHRRAGRWRIRAEMRNEAEPRTAAR